MPEVINADFWNGKQGPYQMQGIGLKLDKIINNQEYPGYIIKFAQQLKLRTYVHPKEFFINLTKYESKELIETGLFAFEWFKRTDSNWNMYHSNSRDIMAIAMLLAKAEGESLVEHMNMIQYCMNLLGLIVIHRNHLEGVIVAKYDNFTVLGTNRNFFDVKKEDSAGTAGKE